MLTVVPEMFKMAVGNELYFIVIAVLAALCASKRFIT